MARRRHGRRRFTACSCGNATRARTGSHSWNARPRADTAGGQVADAARRPQPPPVAPQAMPPAAAPTPAATPSGADGAGTPAPDTTPATNPPLAPTIDCPTDGPPSASDTNPNNPLNYRTFEAFESGVVGQSTREERAEAWNQTHPEDLVPCLKAFPDSHGIPTSVAPTDPDEYKKWFDARHADPDKLTSYGGGWQDVEYVKEHMSDQQKDELAEREVHFGKLYGKAMIAETPGDLVRIVCDDAILGCGPWLTKVLSRAADTDWTPPTMNMAPGGGQPPGKEEINRGPGGARKHKPGRGHDSKSEPQHKNRFMKKAEQKREAIAEELRKAQEVWDKMSDEAKKLRPDLDPMKLKKK